MASFFSRRAFVGVVASLLVATSFTQVSAQTPEPITIRQGIFVGAGLPGIYAAIEQGYFAEEGITLELQQFGNGPAFMAALLGGSLDITHADILAWATAVSSGRSVYLIAGGSNARTPDGDPAGPTRIVTTQASGLTTAQDLIGRTVAVGGSQLAIATTKIWLEQNGVDPAQVNFEIVAQGPAIPPLLRNGTVAAAQFGDPTFAQVNRDLPLNIIAWPLTVIPEEATYTGLFSTGPFIEAHPDVIERYVRAYRRGSEYFNNATPEERARIILPGGVDLVALEQQDGLPGLVQDYRFNEAVVDPVNVEATQAWIDEAARVEAIPAQVDIADFVYHTAVEVIP